MTIFDAEYAIIVAGGDVKVFWTWMKNQTIGLNEDGSTNVYDTDVERFIRYKCNPKNEPLIEMD